MTANLLHKRGATPQVLRDALDVVKPDVLAVQELTPALARVVAERFLHHFFTTRPDGAGVGLAAARPVSFNGVPMPYRSAVVATLQPEDWPEFAGPVEIFNVHLANPIGGWPFNMARARRSQINATQARPSADGVRRVLCGDLNATPLWAAYRRLRRSYRDGILEAAARNARRPAPTWSPLRSGPRLLRIDHVLVDGVRIESAEVVHLPGSDHLAVVTDIVDDT